MKTTRHDSFAAYVLPSVLAFALSGLYTIVDGFFIGQSLGDLGLAAITLAYPAAALLQAVGTGIGLAGAIRCTILQARGEEQTPRTCFSGTVLLLLATSAAFAAVLLGLLGPVLTVLGAQDEARPLAAEYIREKLFRLIGDELPYAATVEVEKFELEGALRRISAAIVVDRAAHKGIVIGKGGQTLKRIASEARQDMERLFDGKVFLEVFVKVKSGWTDDERLLKSLGYE